MYGLLRILLETTPILESVVIIINQKLNYDSTFLV